MLHLLGVGVSLVRPYCVRFAKGIVMEILCQKAK